MKQLMTAVVVALISNAAWAIDMEATTLDGRQVLLKEDQTWEFMDGEAGLEEGAMDEAAVEEANDGAYILGEEAVAEEEDDGADTLELKIVRVWDLPNACKLGLKLTNNSGVKVNSIVPRFTAIIRDGIAFETVSTSFYEVKPTIYQYQEVRFSDISCKDINYVKVHGGDRCSMGDLEKFAPVTGECLRRLKVVDVDTAEYLNTVDGGGIEDSDQEPIPPVHVKLTK